MKYITFRQNSRLKKSGRRLGQTSCQHPQNGVVSATETRFPSLHNPTVDGMKNFKITNRHVISTLSVNVGEKYCIATGCHFDQGEKPSLILQLYSLTISISLHKYNKGENNENH